MKVMVMVKASQGSEAGKMPSQALLDAMMQFNEELVRAGIMESGDGLKPSSEGYRVHFSGDDRTVTTGPFIETHELIAGYWVWNVTSMEEALEWVKKCPNPMEDEASDIEVRPFYEMEDFKEWDPSGDVVERENALRNEVALQNGTITHYLFFGGRCEEALTFYQKHLGAQIDVMMRFDESPAALPEGSLQAGFEQKIMHATFRMGGVTLQASDGCDDKAPMSGFRVALGLNNKVDVERIFNALAQNGTIDMPLSPTFFSPLYGQVTDQFGMGWMVMVSESVSES